MSERMASTTTDDGSTSDGSSGGGSGGIVEFLTRPIGIALVGGFGAAIVAGWYIL